MLPSTSAPDTVNVVAQVWDQPTGEWVIADLSVTDADNVTVGFAVAPAAGATYRAVVLG